MRDEHYRPEPGKKIVAQSLARQLAGSRCRGILGAMRDLWLTPPERAPGARERNEPTTRVGIWRADGRNGSAHWVRAPREDTWLGAWADVERIPPRSGKRILLVGESVARGMHYDPYFNPAQALERALGCEVVDLARTDGTLDYVHETLRAAPALQPDAIVVMAGNNWKAELHMTRPTDHHHQMAMLRNGDGLAEIRRFREERVVSTVGDYVELLAGYERETGVPIVHVLPDFNLCDWEPPSVYSCAALPGDGTRRWNATVLELRRALDAGDDAGVERVALRLVEIDGGSAPTAPFVLGHLRRRQGRLEEAREWLERAADCAGVPRCSSPAQAVLRAAAERGDITLVDLPRAFAEHTGGALPDRRLFLDYCHMTSEGIQVAVRSIARVLRARLELEPPRDESIESPAPYVEACASLCGALYNGRFQQRYEIVRHHADRAVALAPEIIEEMRAFLAHSAGRVSKGLCGSFLAGRGRTLPTIQSRLSVPKANWTVIRALRDAMSAVDPDAADFVGRILRRDFDVTRPENQDVLFSHFWSRFGQAERGRAMYYTCHEPGLEIEFFAGEAVDLELVATLRTGASSAEERQVLFSLGTGEVARVDAGRGWQRARVRLPADRLRPGTNTLRITWPAEGLALSPRHKRPVWGAVHALEIGPVSQRAEGGASR